MSVEKPSEARKVVPPYRLLFPSVMRFTEGAENAYPVDSFVPPPGRGVIKIAGLPEGAVFDPASSKIRWKPDFDVVQATPELVTQDRVFPIHIELSGFADGITAVTHEGLIQVSDEPRKPEISAIPSRQEVREGEKLSFQFEASSEDFPSGPFRIETEGLPPEAEIRQDERSPGKFAFSYIPHFRTVMGVYSDDFAVKMTVLDPRSRSAERKLEILVINVPQAPQISSPEEISVGEAAEFIVSASDPNGDRIPQFRISSVQSSVGELRIEKTIDEEENSVSKLPTSHAFVRWDKVPWTGEEHVEKAEFRICARLCVNHSVQVRFAAIHHDPPRFDRESWSAGAVQYLRVSDQPSSYALRVWDNGSLLRPPAIEILGDASHEVEWKDHSLRITPKSPGFKSFIVSAKSSFGSLTQEAFSYEVLPASWSPVLVLGERLGDPEVSVALQAFPGAAIYHPSQLIAADHVLALRQTLIAGTAIVADPANHAFLQSAFAQVPNIMIATPLLDKLPKELLTDDVGLVGRYLDQPAFPPLGQTRFEPVRGSGFDTPAGDVLLRGLLTSASTSPMLLTASRAYCRPAFRLIEGQKKLGDVALSCKRRLPDGKAGRAFVAGFEWADLELSPPDADLLRKWILQGGNP